MNLKKYIILYVSFNSRYPICNIQNKYYLHGEQRHEGHKDRIEIFPDYFVFCGGMIFAGNSEIRPLRGEKTTGNF
jgi:hypothetical protein